MAKKLAAVPSLLFPASSTFEHLLAVFPSTTAAVAHKPILPRNNHCPPQIDHDRFVGECWEMR